MKCPQFSMWFLLLVWGLQLPAQVPFIREKRDYRWQVGADIWGNIAAELNFNADSLVISNRPATLPMDITKTDICDRDGNLLFYTNGYTIMNRLHEVMENGAGLNPGLFTNDWLPYGQTLHQGALFLPVPDVDSLYILIHARVEYLPQMNQYGQVHSNWPLHYSTIELSQQYPDGRVTEKNVVLYEGQVTFGQIAACRHANGRDWWILVFKYFSNEYLRYLLHPGGITTYPPGSVGQLRPSGIGQAVFSPDGTKYARLNLDGFAINKQHIDVYDFDRCTGTLSNPILFHPLHVSSNGGMAISPNSRYLYFLGWSKIYQYDLYAPNIESSATLIAEYVEQPGVQRFSGGQLAPDGKIYISGSSSSSYIHVIHNPNAAGEACEFEQGGLFLGAQARNGRGITSHAYYGLGPWDGSPCDTLGIDHHPQAAFRHREQSGTVQFWDYSLFFPAQWEWDFGDGSAGSTEQNPTHSYAAPGEYLVCLTVSNAHASSTWCDTVRVEVVSSVGEVEEERVATKIFPNPAGEYFLVAYDAAQPTQMSIFDMFGKLRFSTPLAPGSGMAQTVDTSALESGVYLVSLWQVSGETASIRLLIVK